MKRHTPKINKKGALELSMNTIVVMVIAVTILTLGLKFVYDMFADIGEQQKQIQEATEEEIREMFGQSDDPLALLTTSITLEQGENADLVVAIRNIGSGSGTFSYDIVLDNYPGDESTALDWIIWTTGDSELTSGKTWSDAISIDVPNSATLGTYRFTITLNCNAPDCDDGFTEPLTLRVE
ncbi:MAG: hypothetical protein ABIF40_05665 [archaeon]